MDSTNPRILALDIGLKRTGVAISDENLRISLPLKHIEASKKGEWVNQIAKIVEESEGVGQILVGLPLNQFGEEGPDAVKIREYVAVLRERINLPVIEWDERFTTVQAERSLITADVSRRKRKQVIDQIAASIILQSYLDSLHFQQETPAWDDTY